MVEVTNELQLLSVWKKYTSTIPVVRNDVLMKTKM